MRFKTMIVSFLMCCAIVTMQAMEKQKKKVNLTPQLLREFFVTDEKIKGFLKKHCALDISTLWADFIEENGYLDPQKSDSKLADFFKDNQLNPDFKKFLTTLSDKIKIAFEKIVRYSDTNYYNYRLGIKCQFLQLFNWFELLKTKQLIALECYNFIECCSTVLPEFFLELPKTFYSPPASLLDKHPSDSFSFEQLREHDEQLKKVSYKLLLDGARYTSLQLNSEETSWEKGNALINAVKELMLVHFSSENFKKRLEKGDVSYLSEPLCGFKIKQYDAPAQKTSKQQHVRYSINENNLILPKLFEVYKPEDSKVWHHVGLLGLILSGQVTGVEAQKIVQARSKYALREQDIANDQIMIRNFDLPTCQNSDQNYTCQATLSARDNTGTRFLDFACVCNPQIHVLVDRKVVQGHDTSPKNLMSGTKPFEISIKNKSLHNFDQPYLCKGSLSSLDDDVIRFELDCIEQPYIDEVIPKNQQQHGNDSEICVSDIDYCTNDEYSTSNTQLWSDHIKEVTHLLLNPDKIEVHVPTQEIGALYQDEGYTIEVVPDTKSPIKNIHTTMRHNLNRKAWTVCHFDGDSGKIDILKTIRDYGQNCDIIIANNTVVARTTHKVCEVFAFMDKAEKFPSTKEIPSIKDIHFSDKKPLGSKSNVNVPSGDGFDIRCPVGTVRVRVCDCSSADNFDTQWWTKETMKNIILSQKNSDCTSQCIADPLGYGVPLSMCREDTQNK